MSARDRAAWTFWYALVIAALILAVTMPEHPYAELDTTTVEVAR